MIRCPECSRLVPNDTWPCKCGYKFLGDEPEVCPDPVSPEVEKEKEAQWQADRQAEREAWIPYLPVRSRLAWWMLPVGCYLLSFCWIDPRIDLAFFPAVLMNAPLGLLVLFDNAAMRSDFPVWPSCVIHAIFWSALIFGFANARNRTVSLSVLRAIYLVILVALVLTMYGCASHFHLHDRDIN